MEQDHTVGKAILLTVMYLIGWYGIWRGRRLRNLTQETDPDADFLFEEGNEDLLTTDTENRMDATQSIRMGVLLILCSFVFAIFL
jgi:hypothetical protein